MTTSQVSWTASDTAGAAMPAVPRVHLDAATLERDYNRRPFLFQHELHREPCLRMDALLALALRLDPKHVRQHSSAALPVTADFLNADRDHPTHRSLAWTMEHMETAGSYVLIANAQTDPAFGRFFDEVCDEVQRQVGDRDRGYHERVAYLFISSPGSITPYHLDREVNFLCQIGGHKVVHLFDPSDRGLMSEAELDKVLLMPHAPRPPYRAEFEATATHWPLRPGTGVHHPYLAPHWVANGDEVSVSLAITFRTSGTERQAQVRSMNGLLRGVGLTPRPFGQSPWRDDVKAWAYGSVAPLRPWVARLKRRA